MLLVPDPAGDGTALYLQLIIGTTYALRGEEEGCCGHGYSSGRMRM